MGLRGVSVRVDRGGRRRGKIGSTRGFERSFKDGLGKSPSPYMFTRSLCRQIKLSGEQGESSRLRALGTPMVESTWQR